MKNAKPSSHGNTKECFQLLANGNTVRKYQAFSARYLSGLVLTAVHQKNTSWGVFCFDDKVLAASRALFDTMCSETSTPQCPIIKVDELLIALLQSSVGSNSDTSLNPSSKAVFSMSLQRLDSGRWTFLAPGAISSNISILKYLFRMFCISLHCQEKMTLTQAIGAVTTSNDTQLWFETIVEMGKMFGARQHDKLFSKFVWEGVETTQLILCRTNQRISIDVYRTALGLIKTNLEGAMDKVLGRVTVGTWANVVEDVTSTKRGYCLVEDGRNAESKRVGLKLAVKSLLRNDVYRVNGEGVLCQDQGVARVYAPGLSKTRKLVETVCELMAVTLYCFGGMNVFEIFIYRAVHPRDRDH